MLVGVLMKQVAIAIVLSVLLYCYSLIMGTADTVLPWALKILMIALVTVAVFIYRKPFTHLFSAVGYGTLGSDERAEYSLRQARSTFRRNTLEAAAVAVPGMAGYPAAARWARLIPAQGGRAAGAAAAAADAAAGTGSGGRGRNGPGAGAAGDAYASRFRPEAPPAGGRGTARRAPGAGRGAKAGGLPGPGICPRPRAAPDAPPRRWTCRPEMAPAAAAWPVPPVPRPVEPGARARPGLPRPGRGPPPAVLRALLRPGPRRPPAVPAGPRGTSSHQAGPSWPLSSWSGAWARPAAPAAAPRVRAPASRARGGRVAR